MKMLSNGKENFVTLGVELKRITVDIGTIVYIVLVLLYFVFTAFKKKNAPEQPEERYEGEEAGERRPASFEDMLREIRMEQNERVKDIEESGQAEVPNYDSRDGRDESAETQRDNWNKKQTAARKAEPIVVPQNKYYDGGEGSLKNHERRPLVKLDDQVDIDLDEKILGEVEDVGEEFVTNNRYGSMLKNPGSVKDAVILAEILNRKY
jgi:hypothetical protein